MDRYGDELGRLEIADAAVKKALSVSKRGVAEPVIRDLKVRSISALFIRSPYPRLLHLHYINDAQPVTSFDYNR